MNDSGLAVVGVGWTVVVSAWDDDDDADDSDEAGRGSSEQAASATAANATRANAATRRIIGESLQRYRSTVVQRTSVCVWRATPAVIVALDERFGEPVDAYVNGSQTWLRDDGPGGVTLEWRLHPVAGYRKPADLDPYEVFASVALALETGAQPPAPLESLWDGLEVFAAYGNEVEPAPLANAAEAALGLQPDGAGLVDHESIADEWERSRGATSIVDALFAQLND
jgi:hypothetical protein